MLERYHFKQDAMRSHLLQCLSEQKLTMFPFDKTRRAATRVRNVVSFCLYCICRQPKFGEMIECSTCKEWFHLQQCVLVPPSALEPGVQWKCESCQ